MNSFVLNKKEAVIIEGIRKTIADSLKDNYDVVLEAVIVNCVLARKGAQQTVEVSPVDALTAHEKEERVAPAVTVMFNKEVEILNSMKTFNFVLDDEDKDD